MISPWNQNMINIFSASIYSCLDKSMSKYIFYKTILSLLKYCWIDAEIHEESLWYQKGSCTESILCVLKGMMELKRM